MAQPKTASGTRRHVPTEPGRAEPERRATTRKAEPEDRSKGRSPARTEEPAPKELKRKYLPGQGRTNSEKQSLKGKACPVGQVQRLKNGRSSKKKASTERERSTEGSTKKLAQKAFFSGPRRNKGGVGGQTGRCRKPQKKRAGAESPAEGSPRLIPAKAPVHLQKRGRSSRIGNGAGRLVSGETVAADIFGIKICGTDVPLEPWLRRVRCVHTQTHPFTHGTERDYCSD